MEKKGRDMSGGKKYIFSQVSQFSYYQIATRTKYC